MTNALLSCKPHYEPQVFRTAKGFFLTVTISVADNYWTSKPVALAATDWDAASLEGRRKTNELARALSLPVLTSNDEKGVTMERQFADPDDQREYDEHTAQHERIQQLVIAGVLGRELCPEPKYWHWPILKPEELPEEFRHFIELGEVRW